MKSLSRSAQIFIMGTILIGGLGGIWYLSYIDLRSPLALVIACVLATLLQILKIEGATARSSYNLSWVVYGATFAGLGAQDMLLTIVVAHLGEWLWHRYPWYIQSFNIAAFSIASICTGFAYLFLQSIPGDFYGTRQAFAIMVAMALFTFINHLMVGLVIKWARGQSLNESGVFTLTTLTIDFGLLCLGASAAIVAQVNPAATILIVIVAYLVQSALRVPALERKSEQDSKTGLYNAQHFDQAVQKELQRAQKQDRPISVVMADLDHLRVINNTYGHLAGDAVLKKIAQILQALARDNDVVSRFGGEEFGILLPDTTPDEAFVQAEAMRKAIEAAEFSVATSELPIKATMSFGITGRSGTQQSPKEFIHHADVAVYHAKHTGRNRVCIYRPEYDSFAPEASTMTEKSAEQKPAVRVEVTPAAARNPTPQPETMANSSATVSNVAIQALAQHIPSSGNAETGTTTGPKQNQNFYLYIGAMSVGAVLLTLLSAYLQPALTIEWTGLLVFIFLAVILEVVATEVYSRDTSVSTSVAPLIAAMMAFGILGAGAVSLAIATVTQFRHRKPFNRFVFNISNHLISCSLCLLILRFDAAPIAAWPLALQIGFAAIGAGIIYLVSTALLAGVISLTTEEKFGHIWQERFRWLGLHYLALGVVAFVLFYSYVTVGTFSTLILLIPLAMLHLSQHQYIRATKSMVDQLHESNKILSNRNQEVQRLNDELLLALASTIDLRDPFVVEHSRHVARYAALVATELGLTPPHVHLVYQAGLIHDIGKLAIPEAILFKPGRLTPEEYEVIKEHVTVGADLLDDFQSLQSVATFVRHHHERYDGKGYPDGLAGENIPLEARILALADAVEAMASDRPYRQGSSVDAILKEIQLMSGSQFDPRVVEAFVHLVKVQGPGTIVNSARNVDLHEHRNNSAIRDDLSSWTVPAKSNVPTSMVPNN